jgi:xeroderma pigmentosum group C-complementing protein
MKSRSESKNCRLAQASRVAVNKVLDKSSARGSRGKKKQDDNCDSAKVCSSIHANNIIVIMISLCLPGYLRC